MTTCASTPNIAVDPLSEKVNLHVAIGILEDAAGRILLSRRPAGVPGALSWEFPGGKRHPGETLLAALKRELREELAIEVRNARPLIRIRHEYPDRLVLLDTWRVEAWEGEAQANEDQPLAWVLPEQIADYDLLPADAPIVAAIRLPDRLPITPAAGNNRSNFLRNLKQVLSKGYPLLRLRDWSLDDQAYAALAREVIELANDAGTGVLLDRSTDMVQALGAAGLHFSSDALMSCAARPVSESLWFSASCHNRVELQQLAELGGDFAVLGPVSTTTSHVDRQPLGWDRFAELVESVDMPVYGVGGLDLRVLPRAWNRGAQGVAGITGFFSR